MNIGQLYKLFLQHPSIQTDTRRLKKGDLFFALKGPNFNGNLFAAQALEQGAAYAIIDEAPSPDRHKVPGTATEGDASTADTQHEHPDDRMILVPDVLQTLQDLAKHHRMQFKIPFIAITGSNGKTTTKELIHAVLASTYITYTTEGNLNNHIGVPLTILSVKTDAQFAVIEMGANHQREIAGYCEYTLPDHGLISNAGKAHLEGFGGPEGVKKGKGELYDWLRSTAGTAFVCWDYDYLREMSRDIPHIVKYGTHDADYSGIVYHGAPVAAAPDQSVLAAAAPDQSAPGQPAPATSEAAGRSASAHSLQQETLLQVEITRGSSAGIIRTQLVGDYNLPNVLAAVAVGKHFGVPDERIRSAIEAYAPSNSRSQLIQAGGNHIILDAYNANPSSMKAAIENFARIGYAGADTPPDPSGAGISSNLSRAGISSNPSGSAVISPDPSKTAIGGKILILGAMAELGPESLEEHRGIVDLIGSYSWKQVILVGGDFLRIKHPWLSFENARQAGEWLKNAKLHGAYILIKGSRSMKMEQVLGKDNA